MSQTDTAFRPEKSNQLNLAWYTNSLFMLVQFLWMLQDAQGTIKIGLMMAKLQDL